MISSDQIRAARALLRLEQEDLAKRAKVSATTIRRAENPNQIGCVAPATLEQVRHALEEAGVEFIHEGVRKVTRQKTPEEIEADLRLMEEISQRSAARIAARGNDLLTDDDLYDEHGLPR